MGASTCMGIYLYMRRAFVFQSEHCTAHREIFFPVSLIYSGTYRCNRPALYLHAPPYRVYVQASNGEEHIYGVTAFIIAYICMKWNRTNSYRPKIRTTYTKIFKIRPFRSCLIPFCHLNSTQNLDGASWPENILLNLWSLLLHWGTDY